MKGSGRTLLLLDIALNRHHLVRVGVLGHVGRFTAVDAVGYTRGAKVVCRTGRGLEVGEVLGPAEFRHGDWQGDGSILREVTIQDDLLLQRLQRNRTEALAACDAMLRERNLDAALMDVEHLFDGQSLYFYFLGEVPPAVETLTTELAEAYETEVQFRQFAENVEQGCGPGCGTDDAVNGCNSLAGGCSTCAVGCAVKPRLIHL